MFSTKGRYAVRLMIDLAQHNNEGPVTLEDIAKRQEISKKYLEIVVKLLVTGKLVKGTSGKGGGYCLLRKPNEYTVGEILKITEGTLASVACLSDCDNNCQRKDKCKTLPMWKKFDGLVHDYFYNITIEDLVNGNI